ncbi:hypothetical protein EMCRGX_G004554 [Ephydatia muelleri]
MAGKNGRNGTKKTKELLEHQDSLDMMAKMVRKENLEHQVLLAALVPMEILARKERRVYLSPESPWTTRNRSIIFTFTTCPQIWSVEYVGFLAANPENPGENIYVDTATSNGLLTYPSKDLAVIATGSYNNAYDARVQAAGCSVLALCALFEQNCINVRILLQRSNCCSVYEFNANNY